VFERGRDRRYIVVLLGGLNTEPQNNCTEPLLESDYRTYIFRNLIVT
jgi:hypothetical protein